MLQYLGETQEREISSHVSASPLKAGLCLLRYVWALRK